MAATMNGSGKKTWREYQDKKRKRKSELVIKKLEKIKAKNELKKIAAKEVITAPTESKPIRTCSIAIPGSILDNAQTLELRTYLAGQIARAACIYKVNEIVIFDDTGSNKGKPEYEKVSNQSCVLFAKLLQYLECPQYLRKHFFPLQKDLQYIGLVNPLDAPHHLRQHEDCEFREGLVTSKPSKSGNNSYVNIGLNKDVKVREKLEPGLRVTVKIDDVKAKKLRGVIVSPEEPTRANKLYWGYTVRIANSLSEVLLKTTYDGGYDLTIGTSDKGKSIDELQKKELRSHRHVLIVFGGLQGLETAVENDEMDVDNPALLFDYYLNTCPTQGSRTIRTEEAVLITLAELRKRI